MAIKTIFLGSNWEALATLKTLAEDKRFEVVAVITQPDRPVGRKKELKPTEIKEFALQKKIPVVHTEKLKERYQETLDTFKPELIVVKSFGEIIPEFFLEWPKYKAINVHFSLLPLYRGAIPIQKAILDGQEKTGISIVQMVKALDAGPVLAQYEDTIWPGDTNQTLRERLVKKTTEVLPDLLVQWCEGKIEARPQDDSKATFCWLKEGTKEMAEIDWFNMEPEYIARMVRAFQPWPLAWTRFRGSLMKIFKTWVSPAKDLMLSPGEFRADEREGNEYKYYLLVGTKDPNKIIAIEDLQLEGGKKMRASEFIRGHKL